MYLSRGTATSGFSATIRARPLPSTGITLYLPASTYHVPIIAISRSRWPAAPLGFPGESPPQGVNPQALGASSDWVRAGIGRPKPMPASVNDGPGQGQTA